MSHRHKRVIRLYNQVCNNNNNNTIIIIIIIIIILIILIYMIRSNLSNGGVKTILIYTLASLPM